MMLYRRKIYLALIEVFGGKLDSTDFEKLLFLFCKKANKNYYDFFPYKYGSFSHLSYLDKRVLIKNGYLLDSEKFELRKGKYFVKELLDDDRNLLNEFYLRWKNLRGNNLVRETYIKFPEYAVKSQIAEKILSPEELKNVKKSVKYDVDKILFTAGYEGLTIDAYINKLISYNIDLVIDVRKNPISMKYGFSKNKMRNYLENAGIKYEHFPELGIVSKLRKNLESPSDYFRLFEQYYSDILPKNINTINRIVQLHKSYNRIVLTCFEADHSSCHRHKITEWLEAHSFRESIVHI